jgi:hypothetical protein
METTMPSACLPKSRLKEAMHHHCQCAANHLGERLEDTPEARVLCNPRQRRALARWRVPDMPLERWVSLYVLLCERIEANQIAASNADQPELPFGRDPDAYDATIPPLDDEIPY